MNPKTDFSVKLNQLILDTHLFIGKQFQNDFIVKTGFLNLIPRCLFSFLVISFVEDFFNFSLKPFMGLTYNWSYLQNNFNLFFPVDI